MFVKIFWTWMLICISKQFTVSRIVHEEPVTITLVDDGSDYVRQKREAEVFPQKLHFNISSHKRFIEINLERNDLTVNIPYYTLEDGKVVKHSSQIEKETTFYTDIDQRAAIGVQCADVTHIDNCVYVLNGYITIDGLHHIIRPRSTNTVSNQNVSHTLLQTEETLTYGTDYREITEPIDFENITKFGGFKSAKIVGGSNPLALIHYKVELLPCCDSAVYNYWYNKQNAGLSAMEKRQNAINSIIEYYAYVINDMNVHYRSITSVPWDIKVVYAGIYIAETSSASPWSDSIKVVRAGENRLWIDADAGLSGFKTWLQSTSGLPKYDHAMAFTGYEMYTGSYNPSILGLAWVKAVCYTGVNNYANSIVEDHTEARIGVVAAHELGHNLGAKHDGTGNNCSADDRFVMTPILSATTGITATNHYIFSNCSVDYFQKNINDLDSSSINCLTTLSAGHDPNALDKYNNTNGQIYSADEQCQQYENENSSLCRDFHYQDPTTICKYMYCEMPDNPGYCSRHIPWEGTTCGNGQWCVAGQCCNDTRAAPADPNCVFGDAPFCAVDVLQDPSLCYNERYSVIFCCKICQQYNTGIAGCEYGDHTNGCNALDCLRYTTYSREVLCCKTCAIEDASTTIKTTTTAITTVQQTTTTATTSPQTTTTARTTSPQTTTTARTTSPQTTTEATTTSQQTTTITTTAQQTTTATTTAQTTTAATTTAPQTTTATTTAQQTTTTATTTAQTMAATTTAPQTTMTATTTAPQTTTTATITAPQTTTATTTTPQTTPTTTTTPQTTTTATTTAPQTTMTATTTTPQTTMTATTTTPQKTTTATTTAPQTITTTTTTPQTTTTATTTPQTTTPQITTTAPQTTMTATTTTPQITMTTTTTPQTTTATTTAPQTTMTATTTTPQTTTTTKQTTSQALTTPLITTTFSNTTMTTTPGPPVNDNRVVIVIVVVSVVGGVVTATVIIILCIVKCKAMAKVAPLTAF